MESQIELKLVNGWHDGDLFIIRKKRALLRPRNKRGQIFHMHTRRATPTWADLKKIRDVYKEAERLTRETGEQYEVDHIVPKIGSLVCGLHVHYNLRILHWLENAKKSALWWPDMPYEQIDLFSIDPSGERPDQELACHERSASPLPGRQATSCELSKVEHSKQSAQPVEHRQPNRV